MPNNPRSYIIGRVSGESRGTTFITQTLRSLNAAANLPTNVVIINKFQSFEWVCGDLNIVNLPSVYRAHVHDISDRRPIDSQTIQIRFRNNTFPVVIITSEIFWCRFSINSNFTSL
ncbi:hypothetical protein HanIR_Chr02g0071161 [Helianthus annuus]|nr:hypothetical protein HanIR_Chr02g0071161 [Helianthus annuus]